MPGVMRYWDTLTVSSISPPGHPGRRHDLCAFNVQRLQALALMFLKLYAQGYNISMVLFGCYNLLIGYFTC